MLDYVVTKPNTRKHNVGDMVSLTERHAAALINKVELKSDRGLSSDEQATHDQIDDLQLTIDDLREQLAEANKPRRRGRKPKPEPEAEVLLDGV